MPLKGIEARILVYAHDPETGNTELKEVVQTFQKETSELVHIEYVIIEQVQHEILESPVTVYNFEVVGNANVEFSHGGRHLEGTGLNMNQVNQAIANDVVNRPPTNGVVGHGTVSVSGVDIYYGYFTRSDDVISIGTYYKK